MPPGIYVLVTLPPGIIAKGFELNHGFQPKGLLKGTNVSLLAGAETVGLGAVTIRAHLEGLGGPLVVVMTRLLGPGIG